MAVNFRRRVKGVSFSGMLKISRFFPVPKKSTSSNIGDYRAISVTSLLSKVFEKILAVNLSYFLEQYDSSFFVFVSEEPGNL